MSNILSLLLIITIIILLLTFIIIYCKDSFTNNDSNIPKVIYLTHKTTVPDYVIKNWKKLNPYYEIKYYNDTDIRNFLVKYYPKSYLDYFNKLDSHIGSGPIKADFWRVCILYKFGGVYVDADIEPLVPIKEFLEKDTDFLTCGSDIAPNPNPHIIIAKSNDIILKECLNIYEKLFMRNYSYWDHSIVKVMEKVLRNKFKNYNNHIENNYHIGNYKVQIILEKFFNNHQEIYCVYKNKRVLNNRYKEYNSSLHTY